jgi:hypothetical protein
MGEMDDSDKIAEAAQAHVTIRRQRWASMDIQLSGTASSQTTADELTFIRYELRAIRHLLEKLVGK